MYQYYCRLDISIHALVKRATVRTCPRILRSSNFNPRPREEGDLGDCYKDVSVEVISIHALVKRATPAGFAGAVAKAISIHALVKRATISADKNSFWISDFNPRPREEGDEGFGTTCAYTVDFNPRPREEGDQVKRLSGASATHFNPRPREEGDTFNITCIKRHIKISIHALVKRAT